MKKSVLALILLLIAVPVLALAGCSVPSVGGSLNVILAIPEEFARFTEDVNLYEVIVAAQREKEKHELRTEVINEDHAEVTFDSLGIGDWSLRVSVIDTTEKEIFTATEVISIAAGKVTTAPLSLQMSKSTLNVSVFLPAGPTFTSGLVSLQNYEGNGNLSRPLEFTGSGAMASFNDISANICDLFLTLYTTTESEYTGYLANVKILPGQEISVNLPKETITLVP